MIYRTAAGFEYDVDLRTGATLMRAAGTTNQDTVDRYRHIIPVKRCLISVDVEPILTQLALDYDNS